MKMNPLVLLTCCSNMKQVQRRILMYGQAVLLRHQGTKKLFRCLASSPANDKLAHHIGFSEKPGMVDGSCWFLVCPSTKQRSDGEKVVAGDNILLRSVSNERFLSAHQQSGESDTAKHSNMVLASFQQSVWALHIVCSGSAREGYVNGTDVIHLLHCHGAGDSLSVAARSCDKNVTAEKKTCSSVKHQYTRGGVCTSVRCHQHVRTLATVATVHEGVLSNQPTFIISKLKIVISPTKCMKYACILL
jgi:hypothetical protein